MFVPRIHCVWDEKNVREYQHVEYIITRTQFQTEGQN